MVHFRPSLSATKGRGHDAHKAHHRPWLQTAALRSQAYTDLDT